ncbi:hypothetical protein BKA56DRAFT_656583 [Ilyonectria sp. MPI-CAGE-AT-0026]|nr:hypothetical protein BKA56DRAFT_656583 [Ilyonectria sp. MPI-CAGE-AT-0026]
MDSRGRATSRLRTRMQSLAEEIIDRYSITLPEAENSVGDDGEHKAHSHEDDDEDTSVIIETANSLSGPVVTASSGSTEEVGETTRTFRTKYILEFFSDTPNNNWTRALILEANAQVSLPRPDYLLTTLETSSHDLLLAMGTPSTLRQIQILIQAAANGEDDPAIVHSWGFGDRIYGCVRMQYSRSK